MDVVTPAIRSKMMSSIRGKDTKPEKLVRQILYAKGYRYRLHGKLPGKPDIVIPRLRTAIYVNGCFWHLHDCHLFKWPQSRPDFWKQKIEGNKARDLRNWALANKEGWKVLIVWECALKGRLRLSETALTDKLERALLSDKKKMEIKGKADGAIG